jgi:PAS domain-containing protein
LAAATTTCSLRYRGAGATSTDACLQGGTLAAEDEPFPRQKGTTDWVCWEMAPWQRANGSIGGGALLFSEVITARKLAEQALAESEARLRASLTATRKSDVADRLHPR